MFEPACPPGGRIIFDCQQIFCSPRNTVKRSSVSTGGNISIGFFCLGYGAFVSKSDQEMEPRVEAFESRQIHLRQIDRLYLLSSQKFPKVSDARIGEPLKIFGNL